MSESDYDSVGWQERDDAYTDMLRVWRNSPGTLRDFSEESSSLVEALQRHPVWEKVDALRRTLAARGESRFGAVAIECSHGYGQDGS